MTSETDIVWIAVDWGTTNLRAWLQDGTGQPPIHRQSDKGMGKLARQDFEPALLEQIADLLPADRKTPVIVCGMAGSRQGWAEAPYKTAPCTPPSLEDATHVETADTRIDVRILPGIKQMTPPDVMRGEETQIAGFLAENPGYSGTLCLPGTHTKWVALENGRVERFQTFMTGESYALYSGQSVLRHGLSADTLDAVAYEEAVTRLLEKPTRFAAELFGVRAGGLIADLTPEQASGRLSGILIGAELAAVRDVFDLSDVVLLGSDGIARSYQTALKCMGHDARLLDAGTITLEGLALAYSCLSKVSS